MILVTPNWPAQPWYSQILDLSITEPLLLPQSQKLLVDPKGQVHPLVLNKTLKLMAWKISGKTWLRKEFQTRLPILSQISEDQSLQLITNRPGKKWVSWCSEKQINPVTCSINFVFNFLGNLFENKYEYSTINSHRSAISAYHNLVEGKPVGQHISVCNLITGVFNKNPPKPKYTFI